MQTPIAAKPLYVDSSALLQRVLNGSDAGAIDAATDQRTASGGRVMSSRLLWLETRRVEIRELLAGRDIRIPLREALATLDQLPVTEEVWQRAAAIDCHVKTLDSLHLATCLLAEADLLAADSQLRAAATSLGLRVLP